MKELYTKPSTEVEEFKTVDVITTSGDPIGPEQGNPDPINIIK